MLTDVLIKKLATPEKRREVPDGKVTGLYLVVQPSSMKSWALRYRFAGAPRKLTIGPYPAVDLATARRRAQEALGALAGGIDPTGMKRASKAAARAVEAAHDRLSDVAGDFIEKHAKRKNGAIWAAETERLLRVEILPKLGARGSVTSPEPMYTTSSMM